MTREDLKDCLIRLHFPCQRSRCSCDKRIAKEMKIIEQMFADERLDAWKSAHEQYDFDDVMNKELFVPKHEVQKMIDEAVREARISENQH